MHFLSRNKTHRSRSDGYQPQSETAPSNTQVLEESLDQLLPASWDIGEKIRSDSLQLTHENYDYTSVTVRNGSEISRVTVAANQAIPTHELKKLADSRGADKDLFSHLPQHSSTSQQPATTRSAARPDVGGGAATSSTNTLYPVILPSTRNLGVSPDQEQDLFLSKLYNDSLYYFEVQVKALPTSAVAVVGLVSDGTGSSNVGTVPGESRDSIGLDSRGILKVAGKTIGSDIWHIDNQKGLSIEVFGEGDVIGCAVEVSGMRRVLFTKNGKIIVPATRFSELDMRKTSYSPAVGVFLHRNQASKLSGNFGLDIERPLLWTESSYLVCKPAADGNTTAAAPFATNPHSTLSSRKVDPGQRLPPTPSRTRHRTAPHRQASDPKPRTPQTDRSPSKSMSLSPGAASPTAYSRRPGNGRLMEGEPPTIETNLGGQRQSRRDSSGRSGQVFGKRASNCLMDDESPNDINVASTSTRHPGINASSQANRPRTRSHESLNQLDQHDRHGAYRERTNFASATSMQVPREGGRGSFSHTSLEFSRTETNVREREHDPFHASTPVFKSRQSDYAREPTDYAQEEKNSLEEMTNHRASLSSSGALTPEEIEVMKDNIRMLRSVCGDDTADASVIEGLLECCRNDQQTVKVALDKAMTNEDSTVDLMELININELVLDAIKVGEETIEKSKTAIVVEPQPPPPPPPRPKKKSSTAVDLDINGLIRKKDVFSLICILRAQSDQRLDAALALMEFARDGDRPEEGGISLRDEIRTSGGIHSLLQVFRSKGTSYELRVVAGMAVAYVLPSFVETSPSVGLKIMECLRFLSTTRPVNPNGVRISGEMMFKASAMGVTAFWMNALEPMLNSGMPVDESNGERSDLHVITNSSGLAAASGIFDQGHQTLELQELLEMTVSLIVHIEKNCESPSVNDGGAESNEALAMWRYTNVEQVCTVDVARPIAVREGLLPILVDWIKSKDREKVRPAVSALRYLTSIKDKYMAGWIHSQMVNEGALSEVVKLADDYNAGHDVRLAVAQILSSLCVAPHTRAAVVEANCMFYLIGFLYDHSDPASEEVALFAGRAITQLAAGAITRASVFGGGDTDILDYVSPDKRDSLVDDIVNGGALGSFIDIARENRGLLRAMAVEAIRVLSEDRSPDRRTRLQFVEEGAARALGRTLQDDVNNLRSARSTDRGDGGTGAFSNVLEGNFMEIHDALCGLANVLEPIEERRMGAPDLRRQTSSYQETPQDILNLGCLETAESGGLVSLLRISTMSLMIPRLVESPDLAARSSVLLREACRSLSSLSPLLLSDDAAQKGCAKWAGSVLNAFNVILAAAVAEGMEDLDSKQEIYSVLCGLDALAHSEPLKIRIIDKTLPSIVQLKNVPVDQSDVANVASQVFFSLGYAEDEIAVQVAGSNPNLLADWFCLQRALILQAMVRAEIRKILLSIWHRPFRETDKSSFEKYAATHDRNHASDGNPTDMDIFDNFADDEDTARQRDLMIRQYQAIYNSGELGESAIQDLDDEFEAAQNDVNLLEKQVYPLNDARAETQWVMCHQRATYSFQPEEDEALSTSNSLPEHIEKYLDCCLPSRLLRNHIIPVFSLRLEASFNFRAIMMPQRQYYSFRREGQMVTRLCDMQPEALTYDDVHWSLGFTNSTFAGEFSESLVQALYLCPAIRSLTFVRDPDFQPAEHTEETEGEDGNVLLAKLVGSLPPWIDFLTFKNIFSDREMRTLIAIIETMGKLSEDQDTASDDVTASRGKGRFWSFSISHSSHVTPKVWHTFFGLLGRPQSMSNRSSISPLSSLMFLDLSFNSLGDAACAQVLEIMHSQDSGCQVQQLDLSGNRIGPGVKVIQVIRSYVEEHRYIPTMNRKGWKSPLHTLNLSCNDLGAGHGAVEMIALLKYNALGLKVLDLSDNGIYHGDSDYQFSHLLVSSLRHNSDLNNLNLSGNNFSLRIVDDILERLLASIGESRLAFLGFDNNMPQITPSQRSYFEAFLMGTRPAALQKAFSDATPFGEDNMFDWVEELKVGQGIKDGQVMQESGIKDMKAELNIPSEMPHSEGGPRGDNMITVLFSAPLVFTDDQRRLRPFKKLDFDMERELMWQCMKEASRDIELSFDNATHDRLLAAMTKRCSCLHYSGHGHQMYLPFEDGSGGPNWFKVEDIRSLIAREGAAPFKFVFVSACHSGLAGETFASAGVPHVVCCQQEFELKDTAALAFTRQFYLSLAIGHTVKESFEQGCRAVRATPNLRNAENEMKKFLLLPKDGDHDVPIFNATSVPEWPKLKGQNLRRSLRKSKSTPRIRSMYGAGTKQSELGVRNMMQEDPSPTPPQFFLGREVEMYFVLKAILGKRLVSVNGEPGVGRSSVVCALCHYINERASTIIAIERIYFVKAKQGRRVDCCRSLLEQLQRKLTEAGKVGAPERGADMEDMFEFICKGLKNEKVLLVFDRMEHLENSDDQQEFPMFLSSLFRGTKNTKVLLTGRKPLGIPSLGGQVESPIQLGPLNFENTVRLFANLCPHLHTEGERYKLFQRLVNDYRQAELRPLDPGMDEKTRAIFSMLGDGIPIKIEKAAYDITGDRLQELVSPD